MEEFNPLILAIDPGPRISGYVVARPLTAKPVVDHHQLPNDQLRDLIDDDGFAETLREAYCIIEDFEPWRTPTGHDVVESCRWLGILMETWRQYNGSYPALLRRRDVCMQMVGDPRPKKKQIRDFCVDRWGPGEARAIGTKKNGIGPLYGLRVHEFDALALALAYAEKMSHGIFKVGNILEPV